MREHFMAAIGDGAYRIRRAFGDDGVGHDARLRAMAGECLHQPVDADLDAVGGPGNRHRVEHASRQRVAHRTDARGLAVRPRFETDIEYDGDALVARPLPVRLVFHSRLRTPDAVGASVKSQEGSLRRGTRHAWRGCARGLINHVPITARNASNPGAMASGRLAAATAAVAAQPIEENASAKVAKREET